MRTVPEKIYRFLPRGDFRILEAYSRALRSAERFVYLENQFLWSPEIVDVLADKLRDPPSDDFRVLLVLPGQAQQRRRRHPRPARRLLAAPTTAPGRLLATTISAHRTSVGGRVYVHAKVGIVDDRWLTIGSANLNEHSLFNDTEMNILSCDRALARGDPAAALVRAHGAPDRRGRGRAGRRSSTPCGGRRRRSRHRREREGLPRTHRLALLQSVSRRADRLQGPVRGLLVDG